MAVHEFDVVTYMEGKIEALDAKIASEDARWEELLAQKNADFAAAANEGKTPAEWYAGNGINPDHTPIKKPMDPRLKTWGIAAAGVGLLWFATRK